MPTETLAIAAGQYTNVDERSVRQGNVSVINWMLDDGGGLVSRPGLSVIGTFLPSLGDAVSTVYIKLLYAYRDWIIIVFNNGLIYKMDEAGTTYDITGLRLLGPAVPASATTDANGDLLLARGGASVKWTGHRNDKTVALSAGFAPASTHLAVVQGYLVGNDYGNDEIYYTSITDHSAWDVTNVFQAESRRDPCIALLSSQNFIYLFGTETTDVYYPTNSSAPAFSRAFTIPRGAASPRGVVDVDGTIYFMDTRRRICRLDDRRPVVISMEIEKTLLELGSVESLAVHRVDYKGRHLLVWSIEDEETAFVYDYALSTPGKGIWTEWRGWSATSSRWSAMPFSSYTYHPEWRRHFCASGQVLYELTDTAGTDGGTTAEIRRVIRTGYFSHGTSAMKRSSKLRLRMVRGSTTSNTADPELILRTRDDGLEWGSFVHMSVGAIGDTNMFGAELTGMGMYRERQYEIACSEPSPKVAIYPPEEDFDVLLR